MKTLPKILETRRFHSNLLRKDCFKILGERIAPDYSANTVKYLKTLFEGLASKDHVVRVAWMVSFEKHANQMIDALWKQIQKITTVNGNALTYFRLHVGGDDPAEAYHVEMISKLITKIVKTEDSFSLFAREFFKSYCVHLKWCRQIVENSMQETLNA